MGMAGLIYRKIPVLIELPQSAEKPIKRNFKEKLKETAKKLPFLKGFSYEIILQKLLAKIRILTLKTDNKTSNWLKRLRIKEKIRKNLDESYWEKIKGNKK